MISSTPIKQEDMERLDTKVHRKGQMGNVGRDQVADRYKYFNKGVLKMWTAW